MFRNRFLIVARCFSSDLEKYFEYQGQDYICSRPDDNGMHSCSNLPPLKFGECIFDILFTGFPIVFSLCPHPFFYSLSIENKFTVSFDTGIACFRHRCHQNFRKNMPAGQERKNVTYLDGNRERRWIRCSL